MNLMQGGLFGGMDKAPKHDPIYQFGGYDNVGNPIAQIQQMPQQGIAGALQQRLGLGPGPYSFNLGRMPMAPEGQFQTPGQAMSLLRAQNPGMSDNVFNNWTANNGYDPSGDNKEAWDRAYGTGGVGGRWYSPLLNG